MSPLTRKKTAIDRDRIDMPFLVQFKVEDDTTTSGDPWTNVSNGQVYANIRLPGGREIFEANQAQQVITHVVTIWNPPAAKFTPKPSHQIWATLNRGAPGDSAVTAKFRIRAIKELGYDGELIEIQCEEFGRDTGR